MHGTLVHNMKIIFAAAALALFVVALASLGGFALDPVRAAEGDNVSGWAWSDNIGWISFYGNNYGVNVNEATGAFSGYAWSDAIGWIDFSPDASGAPENPKTVASVDFGAAGDLKPIIGWARACAVFASGCSDSLKSDTALGGWDGWLKMHDVTLDTAVTPNAFSGFAWGGVPVGWVDMSTVAYGGAPAAAPAVLSIVLTPETQSVERMTNANITWEARKATAGCTDRPSGWWKRADGSAITLDASGNGAGTVSVGPITGLATYSLECADDAASVSDSAIVNANPFIEFFTADGYSATTIVGINDTATLAWNTANTDSATDSCNITPDVGVTPPGLSGSAIVSPNESTTYTLSCESEGVSFGAKTARVNFIPSGFILEPDPQNISITSIGRTGGATDVGTGGISNKALFHIRADSTFTDDVNLTITADPFTADPGSGYEYKFQVVQMCDEDGDGVYAKCATQPEGLPGGNMLNGNGSFTIAEPYFWSHSFGVEFWVESTVPLPARSENTIRVTGNEGNQVNDVLTINLNSRLFDPEYREI